MSNKTDQVGISSRDKEVGELAIAVEFSKQAPLPRSKLVELFKENGYTQPEQQTNSESISLVGQPRHEVIYRVNDGTIQVPVEDIDDLSVVSDKVESTLTQKIDQNDIEHITLKAEVLI